MFAIESLAQNRRLLSFLLSFFVLYAVLAFYLYEACHRDPSSVFWRPEQALRLSYSAFRKEQARRHADQAESIEQTKWDNTTAPQLCVGIGSVSRHGSSYLRETLGSLLEGLDDLERQQLYIVVFLAHSDQSQHEDHDAAWLSSMADSLPRYPDDGELLELVRTLENDKSYAAHARKQKIDYAVLLSECAKVQPAYTLTLEDDVVAMDGWFHRTLMALQAAMDKTLDMGRDQFLYLRIFYDARLMGWNSEEWPYYAGLSGLVVFVELVTILALRWRFQTIHKALHPGFIVVICGVCTPMLIGLFFAGGRSCMLPKQPGVRVMNNYGCCAQGLTFPQQQIVDNLLPLYSNTTDSRAAVDTFLEDYANENDELRWAVTPVLIQHVGGKSSHGGEAQGDMKEGRLSSNMPFDHNFETNDPSRLAVEHLAWIEELRNHQ